MKMLCTLMIIAVVGLSACSDGQAPNTNDLTVKDNSSHSVIPEHPSEFDIDHYSGPPLHDKEARIAKPECNEKYELVFSRSFAVDCEIRFNPLDYVEKTSKYWCDAISEACEYQDCKKTHWDVLKWKVECVDNTLTVYILVAFACEG